MEAAAGSSGVGHRVNHRRHQHTINPSMTEIRLRGPTKCVSRPCCPGLPHVDAPGTPDDVVRHTVSIVDTTREATARANLRAGLRVRRHQQVGARKGSLLDHDRPWPRATAMTARSTPTLIVGLAAHGPAALVLTQDARAKPQEALVTRADARPG